MKRIAVSDLGACATSFLQYLGLSRLFLDVMIYCTVGLHSCLSKHSHLLFAVEWFIIPCFCMFLSVGKIVFEKKSCLCPIYSTCFLFYFIFFSKWCLPFVHVKGRKKRELHQAKWSHSHSCGLFHLVPLTLEAVRIGGGDGGRHHQWAVLPADQFFNQTD